MIGDVLEDGWCSTRDSLWPFGGALRDHICTAFLKSTAWGKMTFNKRVVLHRVGRMGKAYRVHFVFDPFAARQRLECRVVVRERRKLLRRFRL